MCWIFHHFMTIRPKFCGSIVLIIIYYKTNTFIQFITISPATLKFPNRLCLSYHCVLDVLFLLILKSQVQLPNAKKMYSGMKHQMFFPKPEKGAASWLWTPSPHTSPGENVMGNQASWGSLALVYKSHFHSLFLFPHLPLLAFPPRCMSLRL